MNIYYGYGRVSTARQAEKVSIPVQEQTLKKHAQDIGLPFQFYSEGVSGKDTESRIEFNKIYSKLEKGDVLGVYDEFRLGRKARENLRVFDELTERGVQLQIKGKTLDPDDPADLLLLTVVSGIGEYQRRYQNIRVKEAIRYIKERGDWIFTGRLFGYDQAYDKNGNTVISINKAEAEILELIFRKYAAGGSILGITKFLNENGYRTREGKKFIEATIRRWILKPIYKGYYLIEGAGPKKGQEKIRHYDESQLVKSNYYPLIISEELWNRANKSFRTLRRKHAKQFKYSNYTLSGILKCFYCKNSFVHNYHKSKANTQKINANYIHKIYKNCKCEIGTFRANVLEYIFQTCYHLLYLHPYELSFYFEEQRKKYDKEVSQDVQNDIARIDSQLTKVENGLKGIAKAIVQGHDPETLLPESSKLQKEKKELAEHKNELLQALQHREEELELLFEAFNENNLEKFVHASAQQRRRIYIDTIQTAYVFNSQLVIRFKNLKTFVVPLYKNRGRRIQMQFEAKTYFQGKYQYSVIVDIEKHDFYLVVDETQIEDKFKQAVVLNRKNRLEELKIQIEDYLSH